MATNPTTVARQQRKAVQAEKRAVTPPTAANAPGSGQITDPSPILPLATENPDFAGASQRRLRGAAQPQSAAPATGAINYMGQPIQSAPSAPDVYAPPSDWRGKQGVANPPPTGNLAPRTFTQITLPSRARNPYDFASGRGTTADAERWQRNNSGSIRSQVYNPRTWTSQIQPGTETNLQGPEIQRELDAAAGDDVGTTGQMRAEIAKAQGTEGRTKTQYGTVQVKGMVPKAEAVASSGATQAAPAADWQQSVIQRHAAIGRKGPENDAYVAAYKAKKAAGEDFDPVALADEIMQQMQQPPALALNQTAQQPMLDVYSPLAAPLTAAATPPGAGKPNAYTPTTPAKPNNTPYQDYRDQQARDVELATAEVERAQMKDDAKLASPQGVQIAPETSGEIGAPKPRPPKYGTTPSRTGRPNRLKVDPYS
jgi:hypothetical protein